MRLLRERDTHPGDLRPQAALLRREGRDEALCVTTDSTVPRTPRPLGAKGFRRLARQLCAKRLEITTTAAAGGGKRRPNQILTAQNAARTSILYFYPFDEIVNSAFLFLWVV